MRQVSKLQRRRNANAARKLAGQGRPSKSTYGRKVQEQKRGTFRLTSPFYRVNEIIVVEEGS